MNVAVIGGGIFGCTVAAKLAEELKAEVHIFETNSDILMAASMVNQNRLHRGYHYPRSMETIELTRDALSSFRREFNDAVIDVGDHYYAIARDDSFLTAAEHEKVWTKAGLAFGPAPYKGTGLCNRDLIEQVYVVDEPRLDVDRLRYLLKARLQVAEVTIETNYHWTALTINNTMNNWDYVINCTYANYSQVSLQFGGPYRDWQYELCEKPVVQLPKSYRDTSIVVMDGPFMCIDPWGSTGLSVLGNVSHAIHQTVVAPSAPRHMLDPYLNQGMITTRFLGDMSRYDRIQSHGAEYLPILQAAHHIGSMFTWRVVPPNRDTDDARPTLVDKHGRLVNVFSGKIPTAVWAAERVVEELS